MLAWRKLSLVFSCMSLFKTLMIMQMLGLPLSDGVTVDICTGGETTVRARRVRISSPGYPNQMEIVNATHCSCFIRTIPNSQDLVSVQPVNASYRCPRSSSRDCDATCWAKIDAVFHTNLPNTTYCLSGTGRNFTSMFNASGVALTGIHYSVNKPASSTSTGAFLLTVVANRATSLQITCTGANQSSTVQTRSTAMPTTSTFRSRRPPRTKSTTIRSTRSTTATTTRRPTSTTTSATTSRPTSSTTATRTGRPTSSTTSTTTGRPTSSTTPTTTVVTDEPTSSIVPTTSRKPSSFTSTTATKRPTSSTTPTTTRELTSFTAPTTTRKPTSFTTHTTGRHPASSTVTTTTRSPTSSTAETIPGGPTSSTTLASTSRPTISTTLTTSRSVTSSIQTISIPFSSSAAETSSIQPTTFTAQITTRVATSTSQANTMSHSIHTNDATDVSRDYMRTSAKSTSVTTSDGNDIIISRSPATYKTSSISTANPSAFTGASGTLHSGTGTLTTSAIQDVPSTASGKPMSRTSTITGIPVQDSSDLTTRVKVPWEKSTRPEVTTIDDTGNTVTGMPSPINYRDLYIVIIAIVMLVVLILVTTIIIFLLCARRRQHSSSEKSSTDDTLQILTMRELVERDNRLYDASPRLNTFPSSRPTFTHRPQYDVPRGLFPSPNWNKLGREDSKTQTDYAPMDQGHARKPSKASIVSNIYAEIDQGDNQRKNSAASPRVNPMITITGPDCVYYNSSPDSRDRFPSIGSESYGYETCYSPETSGATNLSVASSNPADKHIYQQVRPYSTVSFAPNPEVMEENRKESLTNDPIYSNVSKTPEIKAEDKETPRKDFNVTESQLLPGNENKK